MYLTVHPAGSAATVAGSCALSVQVTAEDDPTSYASAVVALTVGSGGRLDMDVQLGSEHTVNPDLMGQARFT
jgi:hypothetical protein